MTAGSLVPGGCLGTWSSVLGGGTCAVAPLRAFQRRRFTSSPRQGGRVVARNRQRRLLSYVLSAPQRVERYFEEAPLWRRWMWALISLVTGFYAGNIVTLSFGALAVNDVFAAVVTLLFCEVVTHFYYTAEQPSLRLWFANCFKMGLIAALLADAAKLGS